MKVLLMASLLGLVACCKGNAKAKEKLPAGVAIANFRSGNYYELQRYEDEYAICYFVERSEATALSCIPKPKL